jgi:TatD DNase family protein
MFIDSHCHLNFPELLSRLPDIRRDMAQANVSHALLISTQVETFDAVHELAMAHDNFWCTAGVHPDEEGVTEPTEAQLLDMGSRPKVVGIGETGLDYYRLGERSVADMAWQRDRFRRHIRVAQALRLPLVIHTRSASDDTLAILREMGEDGQNSQAVGGVFHCFTESMAVAKAALELGFMLSFSGIVTFKNAKDLHEVARWAPLDRMLIETDSPYLAPVPHRGQLNTPALVPHVARHIAELKGLSVETVAEATHRNFARLFAQAQLHEIH